MSSIFIRRLIKLEIMEELFATEEQSMSLVNLGFRSNCLAILTYLKKSDSWQHIQTDSYFTYQEVLDRPHSILRPLKQQVIEWFAEEHDIVIEISKYGIKGSYQVFVKDYIYSTHANERKVFTYTEAINAGIDRAIEILTERNKK